MIAIALMVMVAVGSDAALVSSTAMCTNSYQCGRGMCCRDSTGSMISDQELGGFGPRPQLGGPNNGTCSTRLAQKGELCDTDCQCDAGLACYRPMSGVCCPPMTCYDEAYVKQQHAYWANCFSDPHCAIPP